MRPAVVLAVVAAVALVPAPAAAGGERLGALGDSLTDEYAEEGYGAYASAWSELLEELRGVDFGPTALEAGQPGGTWGEPRRTGFEDNWARYGITSDGAIAAGAHTGLAEGAAERGVARAVMILGGNDFSPWAGAYDEIYSGQWGEPEIDAWIASRIANYETILDALAPSGIPVVVASLLDFGVMPYVTNAYPDVAGRDRVGAALAGLRDATRALAAARFHPFLDFHELNRALFGSHAEPRGTLLVGNVAIDLDASAGTSGTTAAWVEDAIHPHTPIQGVWANAIAVVLATRTGACLAPLTEAEILAASGLAYGGADTLLAELGPLHRFAESFPAPGEPLFADGFECGTTVAWSGVAP